MFPETKKNKTLFCKYLQNNLQNKAHSEEHYCSLCTSLPVDLPSLVNKTPTH